LIGNIPFYVYEKLLFDLPYSYAYVYSKLFRYIYEVGENLIDENVEFIGPPYSIY